MVCVCVLHTGANPLQTNALGHTARAYAKEGDVSAALQEWEGKVGHAPLSQTHTHSNRHSDRAESGSE